MANLPAIHGPFRMMGVTRTICEGCDQMLDEVHEVFAGDRQLHFLCAPCLRDVVKACGEAMSRNVTRWRRPEHPERRGRPKGTQVGKRREPQED